MDEYKIPKNPFAGFNASLMDSEEIIKCWIYPQILFERQAVGVDLTGNIPVVLMGGRGTGKTMLLKFMSDEVQVKKYLSESKNGGNFLDYNPYIGVYYRFDGPSLSSFTNRHAEPIVWETIFKHYFDIVIGQKYIAMLLGLKKNRCISLDSNIEKEIVNEVLRLIKPEVEEIDTLEGLITVMQGMTDDVFNFINATVFQKNLEFRSQPIITSGKLIFGIPQVISKKIPDFHAKNFIILLDEYENLLSEQQKIVNTLIKHVQSPVTFRIGTRLFGFKTYDTLNKEEFLMEDADYRTILFEDILLAHDKRYKELLKEIARKRLEAVPEFKERGLVDIVAWLGNLSPVDEALNVVSSGNLQKVNISEEYRETKHIREMIKELKKSAVTETEIDKLLPRLIYPKNPLIEMLNLLLIRRGYKPADVVEIFNIYISKKRGNKYNKYKELYSKNELGLLFQLISLYRPQKKMYAGFDVFSMLSSGIARNFLELCYQSFNLSLFSEGWKLLEKKRISFQDQTEGAEIRAGKFFGGIERIPEYGNIIKSLVSSLGAVFYAWQKDPRLREPEATYFCIDKTLLSEESREILDTAVRWSVLQQKKPMKGKLPSEPLLDVYALNHILAPYFTISYRLRGRVPEFKKRDFEALISGNEEQKKKSIKELGRWVDLDERHPTLSDFYDVKEND